MIRYIYCLLLILFTAGISNAQFKKLHPYSGASLISVDMGLTYSFMDFKDEQLGFSGRAAYEYYFPSRSMGAFGLRIFGGAGTINGDGGTSSSNLTPIQTFSSTIFYGGGGVVYSLLLGKKTLPYVFLGASLLHFDPKNSNGQRLPRNAADRYKRNELNINGEFGFRFLVSKSLTFNIGGGFHSSRGDNLDDFSQGKANDFFYSVGAGVSFIFAAQKDSDLDGVIDEEDACSNTPVGVRVDNFGCPVDTDGDRVADYLDKCFDTPAGVAVDENGCPVDSDADGVADYLDMCPNTDSRARVDKNGCALDTDNDGVADYLDKCPNTIANVKVDENGCEILTPVPPVKPITKITLNGTTNFKVGKATLTAEAQDILSQLIPVMNEYPDTRWRIEGHTDNVGSYQTNKALSLARAKSVVEFFVTNGIKRSRFDVVGKGPDEPIGNNNLEHGRELNRRVEIINLDTPQQDVPKRKESSVSPHSYDYTIEKTDDGKIFTDGKLYTIQHSTWTTYRKAQDAADKLRGKKHNAIVVKSSPADTEGNLYKVRIGYFKSHKEAKEYMDKHFAPEDIK